MNPTLYPKGIPCPGRYGIAQLVFPARKNDLLLKFLKFFSCLFATFFLVSNITLAQGPCPSSNCTSGDIRITKVELIKADGTALPNFCTPGSDLQIKLRVTFDVTSKTRYGFLVVANVLINGTSAGIIANCDPATWTKGLHTMDVNTFSNGDPIIWPCGSVIQLKDVYTAWDQQVATATHPGVCTYLNSSTGAISDCSTIAPKCKFYGTNEPILIVAPLIASFTAEEGSCSNNKRTWTFTSTTTGGTTPYTYTWNFGDGTPGLVTTQNPVTHEYAYNVTGNVNVSLSVKDASTPTNKTSTAQPQTISVTSCCVASTAPTGASAAQSSICNGSSTNVSVTGGALGTNASWKWYKDGCGTGASIGTGASLNVSPPTTTTYYVRAEGDCGTTSCASVTVTVKNLSVNPSGASAVSPVLCLGQGTDLNVTGGSLGTNAAWKWYAGGCASGASIGTGSSINVSPTVTTTYYVRAEGDCNNTTCASVTVTVKNPSTAPTGASAVSSILCQGQSTNLSVTGGTLGTNAAWKWYTGGCASGSVIGTGTSITVTPSVTTTYYVRAEGDCNNTTCASVTVTVKNPSTNPTGASAVSSILCVGQSTDLSVSGGLLGTNALWKWYAGGCGSGASIGTGSSITVNPTVTTTYFVRAEGDCNNTICASVVVTVKTLSTAPTSATAASPTICVGGNTNISVVGGSLGTNATWKWYAGGCASGASIGTGPSINVNPTQTTTYFVRAEGDCNNTTCASVQVTVNPATVGGTLASDKTICAGTNVGQLNLTGHVGSVLRWEYSYTNTVGSYAGIGNSAGLTSYTIGALFQDVWFRVVVGSGPCSEAVSNAVKITIQWPIGNNYIDQSQIVCPGGTPAGLTGYDPTGGNGSYTYQWQSRTTGSWSNIPGATNKNYSPGPISANTQFQRVVSTGGACPSNTSAVLTISMSPESQVYPVSKTNFCQSSPNTGVVKLTGSYPGVSYQLKNADNNSNVQMPKTGTGSALTWTGLAAGTYYVYGTGSSAGCTSRTSNVTIYIFDCTEFYTLSQGGYGNNGGSCLGSDGVSTILSLLGNTDLTIGTTNSITIPATIEGATKLNQTLPGGSGAFALPAGNCIITTGCFTSPTYLTSGGKINNGLLSQTITLALNARWNNGALLLFPIRSGYLTTQEMNGCYPNSTPSEGCDIVSIQINQNVVNYLGPNATVADLLQLANDVLGGTKTPGVNGVPSYSDISGAATSLTAAFHDGRRFLNYFQTQQGCDLLTGSAAIETNSRITSSTIRESEVSNIATITAFPNPFSDNINFEINAKQSGKAILEVYTMTGQKIKTVYNGNINAGKQRFTMTIPPQQRSMLFYVFRMGEQKISGKLLYNGR